ncbi:MAG: DUF3667 domain-containing protein [Kaistella sp.]
MIKPEKRCRNCNQHLLLNQKFCHECGQRTETHRINFHYFLHELPHNIFHVDGGIIFTLKELFTRPGHTIREYLDGKRQPHFKPVMLVLIMGSVCALIQYLLKDKSQAKIADQKIFQGNLKGSGLSKYVDFEGLFSYFKQIVEWLSSHFAFTVLLMLPIAAFGFFLGFRKYKLNYPEWLVVMLFLAGQSLTVYVLFIFINRFVGNYNALFFVICWGLVTFSLTQLFHDRGRKYVILRSFWSIFLSYFFSLFYLIVAVTIITIIGILMYGYDTLIPLISKEL